MTRSVPTAALLVLGSFLGGCQLREAYHYKSTPDQPMTITLENWATGEKLWSQEIPVGKQLNIEFEKMNRTSEREGYDEMRWSLGAIGDTGGGASSTVRVPPASQRRLRMDLRTVPEARQTSAVAPASSVMAAPAPAPAPTKPETPPPAKPKPKPADGIVLPDPKQPVPK